MAHSDHQAAGDEQPVSLTPPEHQPDIVRSPVCPTEHQQDVYDPQVALPKQERDAGGPPVALPPGEQDASEPAALPKQERDAGKPPVALPPGEQDASEHVHDAGQPLPEYVPEYVPGYGVTLPECVPCTDAQEPIMGVTDRIRIYQQTVCKSMRSHSDSALPPEEHAQVGTNVFLLLLGTLLRMSARMREVLLASPPFCGGGLACAKKRKRLWAPPPARAPTDN